MKSTGDASLLVVISGPSGAGKSTLCSKLLAEFPEFTVSVSTTTRQPREGEEDGVAYHFVDRSTFERQRDEGQFVEWAEVHGNLYGTSTAVVSEALARGQSLLFDIDHQGASSLKKAFAGAILIMLLPPDMLTLRERLEGRGTDDSRVIAERVENAVDEISHVETFDYVVINENLARAYDCVRSIVVAESLRVSRNQALVKRRFPLTFSGHSSK